MRKELTEKEKEKKITRRINKMKKLQKEHIKKLKAIEARDKRIRKAALREEVKPVGIIQMERMSSADCLAKHREEVARKDEIKMRLRREYRLQK